MWYVLSEESYKSKSWYNCRSSYEDTPSFGSHWINNRRGAAGIYEANDVVKKYNSQRFSFVNQHRHEIYTKTFPKIRRQLGEIVFRPEVKQLIFQKIDKSLYRKFDELNFSDLLIELNKILSTRY